MRGYGIGEMVPTGSGNPMARRPSGAERESCPAGCANAFGQAAGNGDHRKPTAGLQPRLQAERPSGV
ncbi:MAG: hypothetical protein LBU80_01300 [Rikenellaceae bacterium]|nr:hypothetical protein [Rikenellaceae bacterium]